MAMSASNANEEQAWFDEHEPFAGKYAVERVIGQGGMGTVFEARHIRLGQRVAIKVLGSSLREYPELVQRFEREARACGSLSSEHAIRVFDIDLLEDGTPFIVMELLTGRDLGNVIERDGPQPVSRAVRWLIEACDAIAEAHRLGIIHRDIKPSNLFLAEVEGRAMVKVLDFGIAKHVKSTDASITQALIPLGTPQYMSPEQVRCAKDVDARSDVWSLGISLYELVCGTTPFPDPSASAVIAAIAADAVPDPRIVRPDLDEAFVAVLMKALAKNAADRYQDVHELVAALAPFADGKDDEAVVTAVRKKIASVPDALMATVGRAMTLDPGLRRAQSRFVASAHSPLSSVATPAREFESDPFAARLPFESRSDRTVPPAVGIIELPVRRRFRSVMALAAAAAVGVATLTMGARILAPAGHGTADAALAAQPIPAEALSTVVNAVVAPARAEAAENAAAPAEASEPTQTPVVNAAMVKADLAARPEPTPLAAPLAGKPLVARPLVPALAAAPSVSASADGRRSPPPATATRPADKRLVSAGGVHGGLSNPGF
ncbi:MAG: hypothetical protein JWP97_3863 [Labilithrix sp.]|nr:hypothetical protein [Labilithrix sp.]